MQFSDNAGKSGLIEDTTFLLGIDVNGYPIEERTRNINNRYAMILPIIFSSYGGWQFIDDNTSDTTTGVPYADQNLTSGTSLYQLPTAALTVKGVSILTSGGSRQNLTGISFEEYQQVGGDATNTTNAAPSRYMLQGDILRMVPTPNYSVTNGLRVYFDQAAYQFTSVDTTKTPGFASIFHRALSVGAALDYAMAKNLSAKVAYLTNLWEWYVGNEQRGTKGAIAKFYVDRFKARSPRRINAGRDLVAEYS